MAKDEPIRAAGMLIVRGEPIDSFLLLKHPDRWDLPKGHQDDGETDLQCALRELVEETAITPADLEMFPDFRWETRYNVISKRHGRRKMEKVVVFYLARLIKPVEIRLTEHDDFRWFPWKPPHRVQKQTIDTLLGEAERFLNSRSPGA